MTDLKTIILAAGKGTRMKSAVPKVLHPVCGKPMIEYVLDVAKAAGSKELIVVLGHMITAVREQLPPEVVTLEQKKLLGTADAVKTTSSHLKSFKGDVLILCGDTPLLTKETVRALVKKHRGSQAVCTFLTAVVHDPQGYGRVIRDMDGKAVAIREDKDAVGFERQIAEINSGVYCINAPALFAALDKVRQNKAKKEFYLTDIIEIFTQDGQTVETVATENFKEALGVNSRIDLAQSQEIIRRRILDRLMLAGVTIVDPASTHIDADVKIGRDTVVRPFSVIENNVRIGSGCLIGPFARIRPGSRIGDDVEVGNFTEVSRTKIGRATLMKHFGFLGDATVGANANIGAGTVTANYDGAEKHPTKIGDGAFIGSDAILVAPVKVGKKAVIGAASVVVRSTIPDGATVVGTPARVIKKARSQ